jgi:hypothetical protein
LNGSRHSPQSPHDEAIYNGRTSDDIAVYETEKIGNLEEPRAAMSISDLVTDWGGFEKLAEKLHETGEVKVERDVVLTGRSGAPRQIDVLIRHKQGLYEHLVVVECKYWNSAVKRIHVDALATTIREVGASRGVIFTTKGFQSGAITQAAHENIDLFVVRDLTDKEWGSPGRVVDIFLQVIRPSIGNIVIQDATKIIRSIRRRSP